MNKLIAQLEQASIPKRPAPFDPGFRPAALWTRAYRRLVAAEAKRRPVRIALGRLDGTVFHYALDVLPWNDATVAATYHYIERTLKYLLWQKGGCKVWIAGCPEAAAQLARDYGPGGIRAFDADVMGETIFGGPFTVQACSEAELPAASESKFRMGGCWKGCRIGFDLGGSDRKCAAVVDGQVVFSEEIAWDPYFQTDPNYHYQGINDSLKRAAAHLPRVDAIGGSAAGIYVDNEVRVASLFRGIDRDTFASQVRGLFKRLAADWGNPPFEVVNDGEVTALAGSMALGDGAVLGLAMGTSLAAGYCDACGHITPWLDELAFAPLDFRPDAPADEWSGDLGCGAQYLSQQAVARLLPLAGIELPAAMPLPERLVEAQKLADLGDPRAERLFATLGGYLAQAVAHYADFYELRHVQIMGRVVSGNGGEILVATARREFARHYPELAEQIKLAMPDERQKRHGQAIAAASLPAR